jgi:hypothetical protein
VGAVTSRMSSLFSVKLKRFETLTALSSFNFFIFFSKKIKDRKRKNTEKNTPTKMNNSEQYLNFSR